MGGELKSGRASPALPDRIDGGRVRSGLEIPRKILHSGWGIVAVRLYTECVDKVLILKCIAVAWSVIVGADIIRFQWTQFEALYEKLLGYFMRESERHRINGTIYYLSGAFVCLVLYPRDIAALSILVLSICDTTASVFGRLFGKYTPRLPFSGTLFGAKKSVAGTTAAIITGTISSYVFWTYFAPYGNQGDMSWSNGLPIANCGTALVNTVTLLPIPKSTLPITVLALSNGLAAGLAEAIDLFGLDDNFSLPVLFGLFAWTIMKITE